MGKGFKKATVVFTALLLLLSVSCIAMTVFLFIRGPRAAILGHRATKQPGALSSATLGETEDYGQNYINSLIFVGDSVTFGLKDTGLLLGGKETVQIWSGENGDLSLDYNIDKTAILYPSEGSLLSVSEAAEESKPEYMVITVGIRNGVQYCGEESFKGYYKKLIVSIQSASPDTKIILQSVFPVSKGFEKENSGISAEKIKNANVWISDIANECSVKYLDTHSALQDSKGYLLSKYDSGDGLHLNAEGYRAVLNYIRTHGYK